MPLSLDSIKHKSRPSVYFSNYCAHKYLTRYTNFNIPLKRISLSYKLSMHREYSKKCSECYFKPQTLKVIMCCRQLYCDNCVKCDFILKKGAIMSSFFFIFRHRIIKLLKLKTTKLKTTNILIEYSPISDVSSSNASAPFVGRKSSYRGFLLGE